MGLLEFVGFRKDIGSQAQESIEVLKMQRRREETGAKKASAARKKAEDNARYAFRKAGNRELGIECTQEFLLKQQQEKDCRARVKRIDAQLQYVEAIRSNAAQLESAHMMNKALAPLTKMNGAGISKIVERNQVLNERLQAASEQLEEAFATVDEATLDQNTNLTLERWAEEFAKQDEERLQTLPTLTVPEQHVAPLKEEEQLVR